VIASVAGGGVLFVVGLAVAAYLVLATTPYLAERQTAKYVRLVAAGDFDRAAELGGSYSDYAISARPGTLIGAPTVVRTTISGRLATSTVRYRLGGKAITQHVTLVRGRGVLPSWSIDAGLVGRARVAVEAPDVLKTRPTITVGGADVSDLASRGSAELTLFPGQYAVIGTTPRDLVVASPQSIVTNPPTVAAAKVTVTFRLADAAQKELDSAVSSWLDTNCFAAKRTEQCSFGDNAARWAAAGYADQRYEGPLTVTYTKGHVWPSPATGDGVLSADSYSGDMTCHWATPDGQRGDAGTGFTVSGRWSIREGKVVLSNMSAESTDG